ncbi:MAG: hypothetical protein LBR10_15180 [Prevotellaceae bacterium]|jgi:hypothetical protein|nr:hypothetical protein [Prevotellaceae bacterium]
MKQFVIFCILWFLQCVSGAFAQDNYLFPEFTQAHVYYKNTAISAFVNYNLFSSDICVLDGNKRRRLENVDKIEYVNIGDKKFIPLNDNVFGEVLVDGNLVLVMKYSGEISKTDETVKGIGKMALNKLLDSGEALPSGIRIQRDSSYYFFKHKSPDKTFYLPGMNVEKATQSGIKKLFSKHKSEIDLFIKENGTDFLSFEHLKRLVEFCEKYTEN